jgi:hypothetical protein
MHINRLVEQFIRRHDFAPTRFGRLAVNDPRLVFDLRAGREIGPDLEARLRAFMAHYRPGAGRVAA